MKLEEIQELIKFVAKSGVSEVELEANDFKIVIKTPPRRRKGTVVVEDEEPPVVVQQVPVVAPPVVAVAPPVPEPAHSAEAVSTPAANESEDGGNTIPINAPMIGTFYRAPGPDKPTFVNVGDEVKEGDVICIIEAMKLFNEIEAEVSGKVVKVLVDDSSPVEYDQPMFLIEPY